MAILLDNERGKKMLVQLPNDAIAIGYRQTRPFHHEQVFKSESCQFEGTEVEFIKAGHGYAYIQADKHTRIEVKP